MKRLVLFAALAFISFAIGFAPAGTKHPRHPNVIATRDGKWIPAAGYSWVTDARNDFRVKWSPGKHHRTHPNVVASRNKDKWIPAAGYTWLNNNPGDLRVKRKASQIVRAKRPIVRGPGAYIQTINWRRTGEYTIGNSSIFRVSGQVKITRSGVYVLRAGWKVGGKWATTLLYGYRCYRDMTIRGEAGDTVRIDWKPQITSKESLRRKFVVEIVN